MASEPPAPMISSSVAARWASSSVAISTRWSSIASSWSYTSNEGRIRQGSTRGKHKKGKRWRWHTLAGSHRWLEPYPGRPERRFRRRSGPLDDRHRPTHSAEDGRESERDDRCPPHA